MSSDGLGKNRRDIHLILAATFFYMMSPMMVTPLIVGYAPEPEPEVTVEVIIDGESRGKFAEGDVVVLHILPDRADGAPFIGWELNGKVYSGQYVIAAGDLTGDSLAFEAAYGAVPEPGSEPAPSGGSGSNDTVVVALMVFVIVLQVVVAFALMRK